MRAGIDLGGTKIEIAILDDDGDTLLRRRAPTPGDYDAILGGIARLLAGAEAEIGAVASVGVAVPGSPNPATGRIRNANTTCLNRRPLGADLATALGRPVRLANDADCFALAEATGGAGHGAGSVFGVILGTGVGGGIVMGGRLWRGAGDSAGVLGAAALWPGAPGRASLPAESKGDTR